MTIGRGILKQLDKISMLRYEDEDKCVKYLYNIIVNNYNYLAAKEIASNYIKSFRNNPGDIGLEEFFRQYGLHTSQGIAITSIAEALLRIPDNETANELIHDKLSGLTWDNSNGSSSRLVQASGFGLKLAGKIVELGKIVTSVANPILRESIKQAMRAMGEHFVMGEDITQALGRAREDEKEGYVFSYDMLGEGARSNKQAEVYFNNYMEAIEKIANKNKKETSIYKRPSISVKLSALYHKYSLANKENVFAILLPRLITIINKAKENNIMVTIDAEESSRLDISLELFSHIIESGQFKGYNGIGLAVQAYNKSAIYIIDLINLLAKAYNHIIPIRLVKGAYWDNEIKIAQTGGLKNFPVFTQKHYTDISYLACAYKMLNSGGLIYPQFATHNALTIASIQIMANNMEFEFQRLHGMGSGIYKDIVKSYTCRIYAPIGHYDALLAYLIRRILENGASTSFLKKLVDNNVPIEELVQNPLNIEKKHNISLPINLFNDRTNSIGYDLATRVNIEQINKEISRYINNIWQAAPIINGKMVKSAKTDIFSPSNTKQKIGELATSKEADIKLALDTAKKTFPIWEGFAVSERAKIIEQFADLLEENSYELISLCIMEAGKTIADSIAEVREAIDFCRYYANQAKQIFSKTQILQGPTGELNELGLAPRGIFLCISPWNFPLAIFTGQIVAALLAGNSVIAKPAEQTPLIAFFAVNLLLNAGLPPGVISLLPGDGASIGNSLLKEKAISGIAFTGSCETANIIQMSLAKRGGAIIPFIAETGGINTMIVDSSALIEQAVDDILLSAFGSNGQRCSALRVLYVQADIADNLISLLIEAMLDLQIGNPINIQTDLGPVIDKEAQSKLNNYIKEAKNKFRTLAENIKGANITSGYYVNPIIFTIDSLQDLPNEVFGPVLHVITYKTNQLDEIINQINTAGYGLTMGVHSRISSKIKYIRDRMRVGNLYINRSMIGAVVGVQPFGGEGLSGTGPKAGGPNYLLRFATERCYSENTTASGGNKELLTF